MKKRKTLSLLFSTLAILLSDVMCAVVAYDYCSLQHCLVCSAPASTAFVLVLPFGLGIAACALLAWFFHKEAIRN